MRPTLDRESAVPLYQQLANVLRRDIEEGRLPAGVAFPSERKLMASYQVTRTTVRSAIGVVKQEGMVVAEHGAGSFVRDPKADRQRVDATRVGMMRPAPPRQETEAGAPARSFRLSAILESAERRMKTTPWSRICSRLRMEPRFWCRRRQDSTPRGLHFSAGHGSSPGWRRRWG